MMCQQMTWPPALIAQSTASSAPNAAFEMLHATPQWAYLQGFDLVILKMKFNITFSSF